MFYECPNPKITCRRIYEDDGKYSIRMAGGAKVQILLQPELKTLSIVIDGKTIYTYTPE